MSHQIRVILQEQLEYAQLVMQAKFGVLKLITLRETDKLRFKPVITGRNRSAGTDIMNFAYGQFSSASNAKRIKCIPITVRGAFFKYFLCNLKKTTKISDQVIVFFEK